MTPAMIHGYRLCLSSPRHRDCVWLVQPHWPTSWQQQQEPQGTPRLLHIHCHDSSPSPRKCTTLPSHCCWGLCWHHVSCAACTDAYMIVPWGLLSRRSSCISGPVAQQTYDNSPSLLLAMAEGLMKHIPVTTMLTIR